MSSAIYCRLAGQVVTLAMHSTNCLAMFLAMHNEELLRDPALQTMTSMQSRYLTVWNIGFQLVYFSLAFACDLLTVTGRDHIPKSIRRVRQTFFTSVLWPVTSLIFLVFWPVFLTNREILFPAFIDKMFSFKSNLVMHFCILPAAIWELVFSPRPTPKSHIKYISISSVILFAYIGFIIHTYTQIGLWPYPFMKHIYGTIYFPIFLCVSYLMGLVLYHLQWKITAMVWGSEKKNVAKKYK